MSHQEANEHLRQRLSKVLAKDLIQNRLGGPVVLDYHLTLQEAGHVLISQEVYSAPVRSSDSRSFVGLFSFRSIFAFFLQSYHDKPPPVHADLMIGVFPLHMCVGELVEKEAQMEAQAEVEKKKKAKEEKEEKEEVHQVPQDKKIGQTMNKSIGCSKAQMVSSDMNVVDLIRFFKEKKCHRVMVVDHTTNDNDNDNDNDHNLKTMTQTQMQTQTENAPSNHDTDPPQNQASSPRENQPPCVFLGMVSQSSIIRLLADWVLNNQLVAKALNQTLIELGIGQTPVLFVYEDQKVLDAMMLMNRANISALAVLDKRKKICGNISMSDMKHIFFKSYQRMLWYSCEEFLKYVRRKISIQSNDSNILYPYFPVNSNTSIATVIKKLVATKVHRLWVVEIDNLAVPGVVSVTDVIAFLDTCVSTS